MQNLRGHMTSYTVDKVIIKYVAKKTLRFIIIRKALARLNKKNAGG